MYKYEFKTLLPPKSYTSLEYLLNLKSTYVLV